MLLDRNDKLKKEKHSAISFPIAKEEVETKPEKIEVALPAEEKWQKVELPVNIVDSNIVSKNETA